MIVATKAIPLHDMTTFVYGSNERLKQFAGQFDNVWIISVTDPDVEALFPEDTESAISLKFHDADPDMIPTFLFGLETEQEKMKYFDSNQAKKVISFIKHADRSGGRNSKDLLLVNCMAGISRSGAIVHFARNLLSLDYETFKKLNPQISPNGHVSRKLYSNESKVD